MAHPPIWNWGALNRALGEPNRVSGADLRIDAAHSKNIYQQLKDMPSVAGVSTDLYQIPAVVSPESYGAAALAAIVAALASGWLVKRDTDRANLVAALKTRE